MHTNMRSVTNMSIVKADFTAEEWSTIVEAPPLAGMRMLVAEHGGHHRELAAIAQAYGLARDQHWSPHGGRRRLIDEIVWESLRIDETRFGSPAAIDSEAIRSGVGGSLRDAVDVLERTAGVDDVEDYRAFVSGLAQHVAESKKEGAFLGIGGMRITEEEQAALDEITTALGSSGDQAVG
jgi:hypothetical protein